jgi:hypothetical protein
MPDERERAGRRFLRRRARALRSCSKCRRPPQWRLAPDLAHLDAGDIIGVPEDGRRVTVRWKNSARHNGLLLTEQCDNYCLMCSQPPKDREDSWLFDPGQQLGRAL